MHYDEILARVTALYPDGVSKAEVIRLIYDIRWEDTKKHLKVTFLTWLIGFGTGWLAFAP